MMKKKPTLPKIKVTPEGTVTNRKINTKSGKRWNTADGETREVFVAGGTSKKFQKNYITTTAQQQGCFFRRDYSAYHNKACAGCKFCYARIYPIIPMMDKISKLKFKFKTESVFSDTFLKTPIVISRYCDPFIRYDFKLASNTFINLVARNLGQVIIKTAGKIDKYTLEKIFPKFKKDNILIQLRVVCDSTYAGSIIQKEIAPLFLSFSKQLDQAKMLLDLGYNVSFIFDPYIIGINDHSLPKMIQQAYDIGIRKFTIKQLFATEYFKNYLSKSLDSKYTNILSDYYFDKFYTYDNLVFMNSLIPTLELIKELKDVFIGICCNGTVNSIISNHDNCCCFDNPIGIYNRNISPMTRGNKDKPLVISLIDKKVEDKREDVTDNEEGKEK